MHDTENGTPGSRGLAGPGRGRRWGGWRGGGRRMRRGDIRTALLTALEDGPAHGYELISRLEEKSDGMWRPSPGSVYPTLQLFEDEGLVRSEQRDGKRVYELTDAGTGRGDRACRASRARSPGTAGPTATATSTRCAVGGFDDGGGQADRSPR